MVKGCEKRMIMVKNTGSALFDEAYFILNSKRAGHITQYDMIKEANRLVSEQLALTPCTRKRQGQLLVYLLGFLTGTGLCCLIFSFFI